MELNDASLMVEGIQGQHSVHLTSLLSLMIKQANMFGK